MTRSKMEQAWLDTPDNARLTSWPPAYIARFLRQIGTDYDFLFTERSARFVSNQWKHRHGMDWAVVTVQAGQLFIRFLREHGNYEVLVGSPGSVGQWFRLDHLCILIRLYLKAGKEWSGKTRIAKPRIPAYLQEHYAVAEDALSPEKAAGTAQDLGRLIALLSTGELDIARERRKWCFLAENGERSDAIGKGPCGKPIKIFAVLVSVLPLLSLLLFAEVFFKLRAMDRTHTPEPR
ncbi:MAG: hypothetical protein ABSF23_04100 [Terracidiphilus sp.]|jgi:hypothetical protein